MGLLDKNNKKQISKSLEISSIKVVMSGSTSVLTALDPLPDYINEGYGDVVGYINSLESHYIL